jgi:60S ribosome subunit biogenesis protein NIP7
MPVADVRQDRVYYLAERLLRFAAVIGKKELVSVGVCMGKFSKVRRSRRGNSRNDCLTRRAKQEQKVQAAHHGPARDGAIRQVQGVGEAVVGAVVDVRQFAAESETNWIRYRTLCCDSNHQAGLARMTDNTPQYQGVLVFNANDVAIGFGVAAKGTRSGSLVCLFFGFSSHWLSRSDVRKQDPTEQCVFHQADVGEYLVSGSFLLSRWVCV